MNFLERAAMKILERGLRDRNKIPKGITAAAHNRELRGEIVFPEDLASADVERMQAELLYYRRLAAQREAELLELQRAETLSNIEEHHRTKQIRGYLDQLEKMNLTIPGGLRESSGSFFRADRDSRGSAWCGDVLRCY